MTRWIEDWFGSKYYSLLYKHRDENEAKLFIDNLSTLLSFSANNKILDCGCGKGRHSLYLSEKGFDVTGIDISEKNIADSKKHENSKLTFYSHDMRNLFRINYYDAALCLFTSFGYFENDSENNKVIKSISSSLKKNGWFVLDFMNVAKEINRLVPEESIEKDGVKFKILRSIDNNCMKKEIQITDQKNSYLFKENVRTYRLEDLKLFLSKNNVEVVHLFGDYENGAFNEQVSDRLILIGKKK